MEEVRNDFYGTWNRLEWCALHDEIRTGFANESSFMVRNFWYTGSRLKFISTSKHDGCMELLL